ncbi:MAG: purine-nucleoside phosphorylase [Clostridiales bacterium]|nr:purine-nucleoside phosphorylase [Clostridiales bacterium]
MSELYKKLEYCCSQIRERCDLKPEVAIVLGSGLGPFADEIDIVETMNFSDIEGFPVSTVSGHKGKLIFGYISGRPVVISQGRVHYYEGYNMTDVVTGVRVMSMPGAKKIILTNTAGAINTSFSPGEFMLIRDHISSFVPSPLRGENVDELGPRFPDMTDLYNEKLRERIKKIAKELDVRLQEGIYVQVRGPHFESPAEIRMLSRLGADAVGMSTVCEAIAARHAGMEICGITCLTNMAAGISGKPLSHEEVKETADSVSRDFVKLLNAVISVI